MSSVTQGEKNKKVYDFYYKKSKDRKKDVYSEKIYPKRFTDEDIKESESNFAFKKKPMTQKDMMMFFIICILALLYGHFYYENEDTKTSILFITLFFLCAVALFYNVKSKFYVILLILIILTVLIVSDSLGYIVNSIKEIKTNLINYV